MEKNKKDCLKDAVSRVLTPLVGLLLEHGVSHREFADLAKRVFFQAGMATLKKRNAKMTHSQLSVLTGLHRKDITVFFDRAEADGAEESKSYSSGAAVIAEWVTNPDFLEKSGRPKPLPYADQGKEGPSFTLLVKNVSQDIRPKAHLEDLLRLGLVAKDEKGLFYLQKDAFLPNEDFRQKLEFFAHNVGDHLNAAATNIQQSPPPYFERSAFHSELSAEDTNKLRTLADKKGMELIKAVYRRAEELAAGTKTQSKAKDFAARRMTFGIYLFDEPENGNRDAPAAKKK